MELDEETIFELSAQSVWDSWEFAVAFHTSIIERREATAERVAEHRKWNKESNRLNLEKARQYTDRNREVINARRRAAAEERRRAGGGVDPVERAKWDRRKAKAASGRVCMAA